MDYHKALTSDKFILMRHDVEYSVERAYELANAMTCRCYNGGKGKTTMNALKFTKRDYFGVLSVAVVIGAVITLNIFCGEYNAEFTFNLAV